MAHNSSYRIADEDVIFFSLASLCAGWIESIECGMYLKSSTDVDIIRIDKNTEQHTLNG